MLGELFFKDNDHDGDDDNNDLEEYTEDLEHLPYQVIQKNENYEQRYYPAAMFVCNTTKNIDTARDPFDGLENMSPWTLMATKRWRNHHTSHMFMELFKYISGVNKNQESVEMTSPVTTCHNVTKEDPLGNFEDQTMCFYLPSKYQENHKHSEEKDAVSSTPEDVVMILQQLQNLWILVLSTYRQDQPCMSLSDVLEDSPSVILSGRSRRTLWRQTCCTTSTSSSRESTSLSDTTVLGNSPKGEMRFG